MVRIVLHRNSFPLLGWLARHSLGWWAVVWFVGGAIVLPVLHQWEPHHIAGFSHTHPHTHTDTPSKEDTIASDITRALALSAAALGQEQISGNPSAQTSAILSPEISDSSGVRATSSELHEQIPHSHSSPHSSSTDIEEHGKNSLWHFDVSLTSTSLSPHLLVAVPFTYCRIAPSHLWLGKDFIHTPHQPRAPPV